MLALQGPPRAARFIIMLGIMKTLRPASPLEVIPRDFKIPGFTSPGMTMTPPPPLQRSTLKAAPGLASTVPLTTYQTSASSTRAKALAFCHQGFGCSRFPRIPLACILSLVLVAATSILLSPLLSALCSLGPSLAHTLPARPCQPPTAAPSQGALQERIAQDGPWCSHGL